MARKTVSRDENTEAVVVATHCIGAGGQATNGFGPTAEFVLAQPLRRPWQRHGHPDLSVNGIGHPDDAKGPQRSLFSWAEFMAEERKPKRRSRKPEPATLSMFEWALSVEEEREAEAVGVST